MQEEAVALVPPHHHHNEVPGHPVGHPVGTVGEHHVHDPHIVDPHHAGPHVRHPHVHDPHVHDPHVHVHDPHLAKDHHGHAHEHHHQHMDPVKGAIKGLIAFSLLVFAVIIFGLIAFQVNELNDRASNVTRGDGNRSLANGGSGLLTNGVVGGGVVGGLLSPGNSSQDGNGGGGVNGLGSGTGNPDSAPLDYARVGLNGAGRPMLFFGLIFAVLQAVTAVTMFAQLSRLSDKHGHGTVTSVLKVTVALGFLAMGLACRHIALGEPSGAYDNRIAITHTIEAFIIISWIFALVFLIMSLLDIPNWNGDCEEYNRNSKQYAISIIMFLSALLLVGLFAGHYQFVTSGMSTSRLAVDNGLTSWLFQTFGLLFAVLQLMAGLTMYQQCTRQTPHQTCETVSAILKVTLAFGILAFGFACRHIWMGLPPNAAPAAAALVIALEAFVIINFFITLFCHFDAARYDWDSLPCDHKRKRTCKPLIPGVIQVILGIILVGLLAAETQDLTEDPNANPATFGLNDAGSYMMAFGLIFAVVELIAGFTMLEHTLKRLRVGSANPIVVTNKVATAIGLLAMGLACRHISLGEPEGANDNNMRLVHAIEAFLIINAFITWFIQMGSGSLEW